MGALRNFRCGGKAKKDPPQEEKSSEKAPRRENGPLTSEKSSKKVPYIAKRIIFFQVGASTYPCPPPAGAHAVACYIAL